MEFYLNLLVLKDKLRRNTNYKDLIVFIEPT